MKKFLFILFCAVLLSGCGLLNEAADPSISTQPNQQQTVKPVETINEEEQIVLESNAKLYVDGKHIPIDRIVHIDHENRYAIIPVIASVEAMGATVTHKENGITMFELKGERYILDMTAKTLMKSRTGMNYLDPPPGSTDSYHEYMDGECYIDSETFRCFVQRIGGDLSIGFNDGIVLLKTEGGPRDKK